MRRRVVLSCLLTITVMAGCATTTGSTGTMRMYVYPADVTWNAALAAVGSLGARREFDSRSSGTILASLGLPEAGGRVTLEIEVRATSRDPVMSSGTDVTVAARLADGREPDPDLAEELKRIEQRYLELLEMHIGEMRGGGRPF